MHCSIHYYYHHTSTIHLMSQFYSPIKHKTYVIIFINIFLRCSKPRLARRRTNSNTALNQLQQHQQQKSKHAAKTLAVAPADPDPENDPTPGDGNGKRSWAWRVAKYALPMQIAIVMLLCAACFLEPHCCDGVNNMSWSLTPQLRYVRGPPPTWWWMIHMGPNNFLVTHDNNNHSLKNRTLDVSNPNINIFFSLFLLLRSGIFFSFVGQLLDNTLHVQ